MGSRLNDLKHAELARIQAEALAKKERAKTDRECDWCHDISAMKKGQRFCCANCRAFYSEALRTAHLAAVEKENAELHVRVGVLEELMRRYRVAVPD